MPSKGSGSVIILAGTAVLDCLLRLHHIPVDSLHESSFLVHASNFVTIATYVSKTFVHPLRPDLKVFLGFGLDGLGLRGDVLLILLTEVSS